MTRIPPILFTTLACMLAEGQQTAPAVAMKGSAAAAPVSVYQEKAGGFTQSPNGDGSFKYIPARDAGSDANFHAPGFDVSDWKKISVPSNWELNGFAEPKYALLMPLDDAWPAALTHPTAASEVFRPFYQSYDQ